MIKFRKYIDEDNNPKFQICPDCEKTVRNKFIFGNLHFCLSEEEILELKIIRWKMAHQIRKKLHKRCENKDIEKDGM